MPSRLRKANHLDPLPTPLAAPLNLANRR